MASPLSMFLGGNDPSDTGLGAGFGNFFGGAIGQTPALNAASSGGTPATTTRNTEYPSIPDFGLPDIAQITNLINSLQQSNFQQAANNRIPGQSGLEAQSSADIQGLLNPPAFFPETDRRAAELGTGLGISGSSAEQSTGVRMTDEERLRRMGLGQQFLTWALGRNPIGPQFDPSALVGYMVGLPSERARLLTQQQQFAASQQQQRDLAIAQMENAYRLAQLQALRSGSALSGGHPSYGYGGYPQGGTSAGTASATLPFPPIPTAQGSGSLSMYPDLIGPYETPLNQGFDLPFDMPMDFSNPNVFGTEDLYA